MDLRSAIEDLCGTFAGLVASERFQEAASWADPPLSIIGPVEERILQTTDDVADDLRMFWSRHSAQDIRDIRHTILDTRSYVPGLYMADISWDLLDRNGQTRNTLYSTYAFRGMLDQLKLVQIISHNEQLERPYSG